MADKLSPQARSALMSRIRRVNTQPELVVRRLLHSVGYRFRIHLPKVPGRPDVAFPGRRKMIQVHGCFWHAHGCSLARLPKSRTDFWEAKFARNKERDARLACAAREAGWEIMTIWECEIGDLRLLEKRLRSFLGPTNRA
jgi:DNA mismatch endonuclease (patch repair protein)